MQQPGPAPVPAGAGRGAGEKRQNQEPHVPPGGKRPAHASGADDNGAFDEDDDGAAAGQQAGGNGGAAGVEPQTPQGPLMSILFPAMVHLNNGVNADTSALLGSLAEGLEEINSACQSFERRAQNASAGLQQSLFACEEKQAHLENVWHTATMQLQRALAGELSAPGPQQGRGSEEGGTPSASVASRSVVGTAPASAGAAGAARDDNDDEFDDDDKDDEGLLGDDDE